MGGGSSGGGSEEAAANAGLNPNAPPPFLSKTYDMVDDPATDAVISWGPQNNSFVVWNQSELARDLLPKYFKHGNFSSFVRQLNTYGFKKVDPDRCEFANEGFLKGQKHLLKNINRRKSSHAHHQAPQSQPPNASLTSCIEVGKFGLDEEIERLKRDRNVLMQELIRLRQQQQATGNQLLTLGKRLQGMEHRQQLMMSFLAKAMQSPGLFSQLVEQNESNHRVAAANKKRRLPRDESSSLEEQSAPPPDGQMIKYQPSTNDDGVALLAHMVKCDTPPKLEELLNNCDGILADNFLSPPETLAGGSLLDQDAGVTIGEVLQKSEVPPFMAMSSGFSTAGSTSAVYDEIQSKVGISDINVADLIQDTSRLSAVQGAIPCEFPEMQEILTDGIVDDIPIEDFIIPEDDSMFINPFAMAVDTFMPVDNADDHEKLIMEILGECIAASPQSGETEDGASSLEEVIDNPQLTSAASSAWKNARNVDNLTAQMGVLASDSKG